MRSREEIIKSVNTTFQEQFEIPKEKLLPEANLFTDLELDSLDAVDMMVHIEDATDLRMDVEKFQEVKTLGDIYNVLEELTLESANT